MNPLHYEFLSAFLLEKSGLALGPGKEYLLEARLLPLAQSEGLNDFSELVQALKLDRNSLLSRSVTEAMTTNETSFFRDNSSFEDLKLRLLPQLLAARAPTRTLKLWCAAAAAGQEPYSVLMTLDEHFPQLKNWTIEFVATDIAASVLTRAEAGVYTQFEIQRGLPIQLLVKYFEQCSAGWQVKESLRKRVKFRTLNLLDNFQQLGLFDIIFCRNVLIYFDTNTKRQILERLSKVVRRDGYLLLGAAETVLGISDKFTRDQSCKSGVYSPSVGVSV